MIMFRTLLVALMVLLFSTPSRADMSTVNAACPDANIFSNVIDQVCWSCFLNSLKLFGVGSKPDGASSKLNLPACTCTDALGVPEFGWPLGYWSPQKLSEQTIRPWCSPSLGGIKLQDSLTGSGHNKGGSHGEADIKSAFYQYHYFSYPIMSMLGMLLLPDCSSGYVDMDLMYISEIDPLWNNSLLSLILNPEAILFATPMAKAWCAKDCILTTAGNQKEEFYGCAACDGSLYPLVGTVFPQPDPVAGTSLIAQRVLAGLHRKGLARKTIGDAAMCSPGEYTAFIPRTQYKFSMMYPIPQSKQCPTPPTPSAPLPPSGGNAGAVTPAEQAKLDDKTKESGSAGTDAVPFDECCHEMGMSTARWCTPYGGRTRPGKDTAYIYQIWQYQNCCIRSIGK